MALYIMLCAIDRALGRKIMEDLTGLGRERFDRLPTLVSGENKDSEAFVYPQTLLWNSCHNGECGC